MTNLLQNKYPELNQTFKDQMLMNALSIFINQSSSAVKYLKPFTEFDYRILSKNLSKIESVQVTHSIMWLFNNLSSYHKYAAIFNKYKETPINVSNCFVMQDTHVYLKTVNFMINLI